MIQNITTPIVSFIVGVIVGGILGYFLRGILDKKISNDQNTEARLVLVIVTIVWAGSVLVDILSATYETSPFIHGLMGAIVGFFFKPWKVK